METRQSGGGLNHMDVEAGIRIPDANGGRPGATSEADRESFSADPALGFLSGQLGEVADVKAKQVRTWMIVAGLGWGVAGLFGYGYFRNGQTIMNFRFPYVLASNGTVQLVSAWPEGAGTVGIQKYEKWVVEYMVRRFLEARYGASNYHARNIWPTFQAFWLRPMDIAAHNDYSQRELAECLRTDSYLQVVDRSILFDRVTDMPNHEGMAYDATVEYIVYRRKNVTDEVVGMQAYKARLRFTMGTPFGETNKDRLELWGKINPLHFTLLERVEAAPVTVNGGAEGMAMAPRGAAAPSWTGAPVTLPPPPPAGGPATQTPNNVVTPR